MQTGYEYWPSRRWRIRVASVRVGHVGLGPGQAAERATEIIEHEIDVST
jgi:hypothetical protein